MAMNIDSLRKHYHNLTPYERAAMQCQAVKSLDDELNDALQSPSLSAAYHEATYREAFVIIGLAALHESQKQEVAYWACMAGKLLEDRDGPQGRERPLGQYIEDMKENEHGRDAWLLALKAFDDEMGAACIASVYPIAGRYIDIVLNDVAGEQTDYSFELSVLRRYWHDLMQCKKDAPRVAGPMYEEDEASRQDIN